jgi:hypothetical protein
MIRLRRMVSAMDIRISEIIFCLVLLSLCGGAQSQVKDVKSRHENLRLAYESVEEGNDHQAAIASVEAGLGGEGESTDQLRALEQDSSALLNSLRDVLPKPEELQPVRAPSIEVIATSNDILSDLKSAALARLEKKIQKELLKETAKLGPTANKMVGPTAESDKLPTPNVAAKIYKTVREKLTALPWVRVVVLLGKILLSNLDFVALPELLRQHRSGELGWVGIQCVLHRGNAVAHRHQDFELRHEGHRHPQHRSPRLAVRPVLRNFILRRLDPRACRARYRLPLVRPAQALPRPARQ